jgi:hypothetical protein
MLGDKPLKLDEVFPRAEAVQITSLESSREKLEELASAITEAVRELRKGSSRNA